MILEFSILPVGVGESLSKHVAGIVKIVEESGLPNRTHAMGTVVEGDWDELLALVKRCHDEVLSKSPRVVTSIKIDDRPGKPGDRITGKLESIEAILGREINK
ncbi:MAG: MTH1187 family thiamine-binding protein [Thermodesulfobacteriota bacterium]